MKRNIHNICPRCGINQRLPGGWCRPCKKDWAKEYRRSPHGIAKRRAYQQNHKPTEQEREQRRIAQAKYRKNHPRSYQDPVRNYKYRLKNKYGMSIEDRNLLLMQQQFLCAACRIRLKSDAPNSIHIDHCHDTKRVRGILCSDCNISLGRMKEDPDRIAGLAAYAAKIKIEHPATIPLPPSSFALRRRRKGVETHSEIEPTTNHGE
jgi:hypothetical protein